MGLLKNQNQEQIEISKTDIGFPFTEKATDKFRGKHIGCFQESRVALLTVLENLEMAS